MVIGFHLILSGYGTWLSNDPRGSGSDVTRKAELDELGPVHQGRKSIQPPRPQVKAFYKQAEPRLDFPQLWFDEAMRDAIGMGFARAVEQNKYTVWAGAVCRNHAHLCVRKHRHSDVEIRDAFANASRDMVIECRLVDPAHPVWSSRPYSVFLRDVRGVESRIRYVEENPMKEGLAKQAWAFVRPYDGWPSGKWRFPRK